MAEKQRLLDVWLVEDNKVYRQVPFMVVVDWVQQGRLIEEDKVRVAGTEKWIRIANTSALAAYLPRVEPHRADDQAEALEPVEVDFAWQPRKDDEDGDVDMIPLIDISLVLLIFFIITTKVANEAFPAELPQATFTGDLAPSSLWVGIQRNSDGTPTYTVGTGDSAPTPENQGLTEDQAIKRIEELAGPGSEVRIAADRGLKTGLIASLTARLQAMKSKVARVTAEVHEKKP